MERAEGKDQRTRERERGERERERERGTAGRTTLECAKDLREFFIGEALSSPLLEGGKLFYLQFELFAYS